MSTKRLFQVFDEMNVNDEKNKTALLPCAFTMVEAKTAKGGGHVTMGVEAGIIQKLFLGEVQAVLVVFDKKEYHRLADEPIVDKLHEAQQEVARLTNWQQEAKVILNPIWDYADTLNVPLGESKTDFVIKHAEEAKNLLTEVFQKHESGLLPDRFIYEKIKRFLYGE